MKKYVLLLFCISFLSSCSWWEKGKESAEASYVSGKEGWNVVETTAETTSEELLQTKEDIESAAKETKEAKAALEKVLE